MLHKNMHPAGAALCVLHNTARNGCMIRQIQMSNTPRMTMPATTSAIMA